VLFDAFSPIAHAETIKSTHWLRFQQDKWKLKTKFAFSNETALVWSDENDHARNACVNKNILIRVTA